MYPLWLLVIFAGCASFAPGPDDVSAADLRSPAPPFELGAAPDLARGPDLSPAADLRLPLLDLLGAYAYPRVNEIAPAAGGVNDDEVIELVGGSMDTPLKDYSVHYQSAAGNDMLLVTFGDVVLKAGSYLLVTSTASRYVAMAEAQYNAGTQGRLAKAAGAIGLLSPTGVKVDGLGWGSATGSYVEDRAAAAPGDQGCSRLPDGLDTEHNQTDARPAALTPKAANL